MPLSLVGRPSRPRLWTLLFLVFVISVLYSVEVKRNIKLIYDYTLLSNYHPPAPLDRDAPPTYTKLRELEESLPQHNPALPFPEGKSGRYVLFANSRVHQAGWNNKLNDMLLNTWLAHESNRAYVFHDFIWEKTHYPWRTSANASNPRTPLTALVAGPSAGGAWDPSDLAPRSVSEAYFDLVCPKHARRIINTRDVKPALRDADGKVIFETWRKLLKEAPERCVVIEAPTREEDAFPETFDIWFWSGRRSVSLWNTFKDSPVSRLLGTSRTVQSALDDNARLFQPPHNPHTPNLKSNANPFTDVFSIHVRRGDFKQACVEHAELNSTFYNWNLLPFLPDKFNPPSIPHPENEPAFLARCLPSPEAIARKVREARKEYLRHANKRLVGGDRRGLDVLYIMSNDGTTWLDALKETLRADGWGRIVTSRDLRLTPEQKDVGVAVDMDIGRQSAVFIGNGWSSFTSNVVHRRLVDGKEPISIRFW